LLHNNKNLCCALIRNKDYKVQRQSFKNGIFVGLHSPAPTSCSSSVDSTNVGRSTTTNQKSPRRVTRRAATSKQFDGNWSTERRTGRPVDELEIGSRWRWQRVWKLGSKLSRKSVGRSKLRRTCRGGRTPGSTSEQLVDH